MSPRTTGYYGGLSAEERRSSRRTRLLEAVLELLGVEGSQGATVRSVCARAGLTPRYFYESFEDLDAAIVAAFDDVVAEATTAVLEAAQQAPADARAKARAAIGAFVELLTDDPRKARLLFVEAIGSERLIRRRFETLRMFAALVAEQAREFYGRRSPDDPLTDLSALMLTGGLAETLLAWLDGTLALSREELIESCADLFVATGEIGVGLARARRKPR